MAMSREDLRDKRMRQTIEGFLNKVGKRLNDLGIGEREYDQIEKLVYSEKWDEIETGIGFLQALLGEQAIDPCNIRGECYPAGFNSLVLQWKVTQMKNTAGKCPNCGQAYDGGVHLASIDHINAVSQHWNTIGYRSGQAERDHFYNDIANLKVICKSCNSSKGGEPYRKVPAYGSGFSLA